MSDYAPHIVLALVAALAAAALVWVAQAGVPASWRWRNVTLRALSVAVGTLAGLAMGMANEEAAAALAACAIDAGAIVGSTWGAVIGAGAGGLATTAVALVRARARRMGGG